MGCAATRGHIDVSGLHCHCGLTSAGSGEAVFVVYAVTRNHTAVFPLAVKSKEDTFAVILITADSQLRKRDMEGFCDNPFSFKKKQSEQEAIKRTL